MYKSIEEQEDRILTHVYFPFDPVVCHSIVFYWRVDISDSRDWLEHAPQFIGNCLKGVNTMNFIDSFWLFLWQQKSERQNIVNAELSCLYTDTSNVKIICQKV